MSFKNVLEKNPIQISAAVILVINFLIAAEVFTMKPLAVAALNSALVGVMALFVSNKTANKAVLNEMQAEFDNQEMA